MNKDTSIIINDVKLNNDEGELVINSLMIMGQWIERIQENSEIGAVNKSERDLDYINDDNDASRSHAVVVAYLSIENVNHKVCIVSHCSVDPQVEGFGACLVDSNDYSMIQPKNESELRLLSIVDASFPFSTMNVPQMHEEINVTKSCEWIEN